MIARQGRRIIPAKKRKEGGFLIHHCTRIRHIHLLFLFSFSILFGFQAYLYSSSLASTGNKDESLTLANIIGDHPTHINGESSPTLKPLNKDNDYYMYDESDPEAAWIGGVSKAATKDAIENFNSNNHGKVHLLVSHCDMPLDYIFKNFINSKAMQDRVASITIISKCGKTIEGAPESSGNFDNKVIILPNLGRCDHSYAYWISNIAYNDVDKYGDNDIVYFIKDNDHQFEMWRSFEDMLGLALINGFSCAQVIEVTFRNIFSLEASYFHKSTLLQGFNISFHVRGGQDFSKEVIEEHNVNFDSADYPNLAAYISHIGLDLPAPHCPVCYGGAFAAKVSQLRSQNIVIWKNIESSLSRGDNIKEGHFVERLWASLLAKPLSPDTIAALDQEEKFCRNTSEEISNFSVKTFGVYTRRTLIIQGNSYRLIRRARPPSIAC